MEEIIKKLMEDGLITVDENYTEEEIQEAISEASDQLTTTDWDKGYKLSANDIWTDFSADFNEILIFEDEEAASLEAISSWKNGLEGDMSMINIGLATSGYFFSVSDEDFIKGEAEDYLKEWNNNFNSAYDMFDEVQEAHDQIEQKIEDLESLVGSQEENYEQLEQIIDEAKKQLKDLEKTHKVKAPRGVGDKTVWPKLQSMLTSEDLQYVNQALSILEALGYTDVLPELSNAIETMTICLDNLDEVIKDNQDLIKEAEKERDDFEDGKWKEFLGQDVEEAAYELAEEDITGYASGSVYEYLIHSVGLSQEEALEELGFDLQAYVEYVVGLDGPVNFLGESLLSDNNLYVIDSW